MRQHLGFLGLLPVKTGLTVVILFFAMLGLLWPVRAYTLPIENKPDLYIDDSGTAYALPYIYSSGVITFVYHYVPRYTALDLQLKIDLAASGQLSLYTESYKPPGNRQFVPLVLTGSNGSIKNYTAQIPALASGGEGLYIWLDTKTTLNQSQHTLLDYKLSMPAGHFTDLFYPNFYLPAGLLLLTIMCAWLFSVGFSFGETLLLAGLNAYTIVSATTSSYAGGGLMLLAAVGFGAAFGWEKFRQRRNLAWSARPLFLGIGLLLLFFLATNDIFLADFHYYASWMRQLGENGLWNFYEYSYMHYRNYPYDYLPLLSYFYLFYKPFGDFLALRESYNLWRLTFSLLFILMVGIAYLLIKQESKGQNPVEQTSHRQRGIMLLGFNAAIFYNPAIWGQADILALVSMVLCLWLIYLRQRWWSGFSLALTTISKPQAWFVLPTLIIMLLKQHNTRQGKKELLLSIAVIFLACCIPFGMSLQVISTYFKHPEFIGPYNNDSPSANNLNYLILGELAMEPPFWLTGLGCAVVLAIVGLISYFLWRSTPSLKQYLFGSGLLALTCFVFLIKMKERYIIFSLPFLGLVALYKRRQIKFFLLLSWIQLTSLTITQHNTYFVWVRRVVTENFTLWSEIINEDLTRVILSVGVLGLFGYYALDYFQQARQESES